MSVYDHAGLEVLFLNGIVVDHLSSVLCSSMDENPVEAASRLLKETETRVLETDSQHESSDLKEDCKDFVDSTY